ncbi:hypothetical protein P5673_029672 [Acropora cervicornis]|uniref:Uncharacterized protein n=1 Tax=Acropora cervicornis TaxID=6130 RepID=A0AAD9PWC3_ACRCE|nr:hypothetical protein P5673_029672 [Acropora cervicornis]
MRPRLKRLNPVKYLNRQELDKDLLYLHKALENKVPPESEDWPLPHLIDTCKCQCRDPMRLHNPIPEINANPFPLLDGRVLIKFCDFSLGTTNLLKFKAKKQR